MPVRLSVMGITILSLLRFGDPLLAQVHYYDRDSPWAQRADSGPDAEVPGWFLNLGLTGLRAQLVEEEPKTLLIKYVFPDSPASTHIQAGDFIIGAGGQLFKEPHRNGYGESVFGADGPVLEMANVLEKCQSGDGKLSLTLRRGTEIKEVVLEVDHKYGAYSATYPADCPKSDKILAELLEYLVKQQSEDGSFGDPVHNTFAPLALLASGEARYKPAVKQSVKYLCRETVAKDKDRFGLINWHYMSAAIVVSEYYLATGEKWVLPELQEIYDHLAKAQYLHMSQINPKAKKSHPDSYPKGPEDSHGGWGHNPGFEGYGPIAMLTGQGALAYSLMHRCGIKIDRDKHEAAYKFLRKGSGANGYVWYGDGVGGPPDGWADMGRTGAAGIANNLSPYDEPIYRERAMLHAKVIGEHPQSFPDTHGSPPMGMAYTALAAHVGHESFRKLMDANRWWFTMSQCTDGTFYYQPNRDNAGYDSDARKTASCVVAFIYSIPKQSLVMTKKKKTATDSHLGPFQGFFEAQVSFVEHSYADCVVKCESASAFRFASITSKTVPDTYVKHLFEKGGCRRYALTRLQRIDYFSTRAIFHRQTCVFTQVCPSVVKGHSFIVRCEESSHVNQATIRWPHLPNFQKCSCCQQFC